MKLQEAQIYMLYRFYQKYTDEVRDLLNNLGDNNEWMRTHALLYAFSVADGRCVYDHHRLSEETVECLKAFRAGLDPEDLCTSSNPEFTTLYTSPWAEVLNKLGINPKSIKAMLEDIPEDPERLLEIANWVKESWPTWKQKIQKYQEEYQPTLNDIVTTLGELAAPLTELPFKFLFGLSIREEMKEEKDLRKVFKEAIIAYTENQKNKK